MRIDCPFCGERDSGEFAYLGASNPRAGSDVSDAQMFTAVYVRENPVGANEELWYHAWGCRSWLLVARNTLTHAILSVALAKDARS